MKTVEFFKKKTVLSYEVFPPKPTSPVNTIYDTLNELKQLNPDFISVTYGAGGGKNNTDSFKIASAIKNSGIESVAHLPCIALTKNDVSEKLEQLKKSGIENILALRGDIPNEEFTQGDFRYACEMIEFIKQHGDFNILAACYPEGHIEAKSKEEDIKNLKTKVDSGADHLVTQLFFDNNYFYTFIDKCRCVGISTPIEAGIMPVTNKKQIVRMATMCGTTVPEKLASMMEKYENDPIAMREAGIEYAVEQIADLISQGVDGIHLYTMNNPYIARKIYEAVHNLI